MIDLKSIVLPLNYILIIILINYLNITPLLILSSIILQIPPLL